MAKYAMVSIMKPFDYEKYLRNNLLLKEDQSVYDDKKKFEENQTELVKLFKKYPSIPVSPEKKDDYLPGGRSLRVHFFNGENIHGYKSIIRGVDGGSGESVYFLIKYDKKKNSPYGEYDSIMYWQVGYESAHYNPFKNPKSLIYKMQNKYYPYFNFDKYLDKDGYAVVIPMHIWKSKIGLSKKQAEKIQATIGGANGYFQFLPHSVKIWR